MKTIKQRVFMALSRLFLNKEAQELAYEFNKSGIKEARVGEHGGFFVDSQYIRKSKEFKKIYEINNDK